MNPTEQRLHDLLHRAVPAASPVSLESVAQRVNRRWRQRLSVVSSAVAVIGVAAAVTLVSTSTPRIRVLNGPTPTAATEHKVPFQGVTFTLPEGWTTGRTFCGPPPDHVLVLEDRANFGLRCPYIPRPVIATTSVGLSTLYGRQYTLGWAGQPTQWHGQPAWISHGSVQGGTFWTLVLPRLNVVVTTQAPESDIARGLLDRVSGTTGTGLDVPRTVSSVYLQSFAGYDGDGVVRSITLTRPDDVRLLLEDLRALPLLPSSATACGPDLSKQMAVLTAPNDEGGERSYLIRFAGCHQVIAGTGAAAASSQALLDDIRGLLPTSGL